MYGTKDVMKYGLTFHNDWSKLYKRDSIKGSPLRNCITENEGRILTSNIHGGANGVYQGSKALARQIMRQGFN